MTEEVTNPSPAHLVRLTHPDPNVGTEQWRGDVPEGEDPADVARRWFAEGRNDLRWLEAEAELVDGDGGDQADEQGGDQGQGGEQGQGGDQGQGGTPGA